MMRVYGRALILSVLYVSLQAPAVQGLCDNEGVDAMTFVGSSKIAEMVAQRCR